MRLSGTLRSWNDDRGFGFIAPTHGGAELFVHITALPRDGSRPTVGEKVTYELAPGKNGKPQAANVQREAIGQWTQKAKSAPNHRPKSSFLGTKTISLLLIASLCAYGYNSYQSRDALHKQDAEPVASRLLGTESTATSATTFNCDGRTHCSQMTSCTEAKLFLKNCPGTQMDGNNDGVPCEQQWCTSPFAK
jgi:cold shock CspA family protein